jgi:hypothetical protein
MPDQAAIRHHKRCNQTIPGYQEAGGEGKSEIVSDGQDVHDAFMTNEAIKETFEEIEEASEIHVKKVDTLSKDVNSLKEDLGSLLWILQLFRQSPLPGTRDSRTERQINTIMHNLTTKYPPISQ